MNTPKNIYSVLKSPVIPMTVFVLPVLFYSIILTSCIEQKDAGKADEGESPGIHKTFERGPLTVKLDVDKKEISIADRLNLSITVISDEDYKIELPSFGSRLEQFGVLDYHTSRPELVDDNRQKTSRSYLLEPFLSGDYKISPMEIHFRKKGEEEADRHTIETEEITIKVNSLLPENMEDIELHDIRPPVNFPYPKAVWLWAGLVFGVTIVAAILIIILRNRKKRALEIIQAGIAPHELAYEELQRLVSEDLIKKGEIKLFYQRISDILRHYIENRFRLHAPEETTEEFLVDLESSSNFPDKYRPLLKVFLFHCDLVKFAEHQPTTEDIQKTFDSCKDFIAGTEHKVKR
ncbi:MAG: protein BatD [Desulfobacterales bacterium]|nr:protein BatD [Desulfobacterales bacterium]